jgi:hypothetical protein
MEYEKSSQRAGGNDIQRKSKLIGNHQMQSCRMAVASGKGTPVKVLTELIPLYTV